MGIFFNDQDYAQPVVPPTNGILTYGERNFLEQATIAAVRSGASGMGSANIAITALDALNQYADKLKEEKESNG